MAQSAGSADLPLHGGRVPKRLDDRTTRLGLVMGMDCQCSGIITSVIGVLKRYLPRSRLPSIAACQACCPPRTQWRRARSGVPISSPWTTRTTPEVRDPGCG